MGGGWDRPMASRPDVIRGRLTPATEDLSALTASGDDPTVLAFVLGCPPRSDGGPAGPVVYEVLNQPEPPTCVYRPDGGSGAEALAAVNRALDDAGFQPAAVPAEGLTSAHGSRTSPLTGWLIERIPHDGQWAARLDGVLTGPSR
jgi:hypothetical protein